MYVGIKIPIQNKMSSYQVRQVWFSSEALGLSQHPACPVIRGENDVINGIRKIENKIIDKIDKKYFFLF